MADDTLKRSREDSAELDVGVELPPGPVPADEDEDLVGPVLPPQTKKRKVLTHISGWISELLSVNIACLASAGT